jgi:hypothetical protein
MVLLLPRIKKAGDFTSPAFWIQLLVSALVTKVSAALRIRPAACAAAVL